MSVDGEEDDDVVDVDADAHTAHTASMVKNRNIAAIPPNVHTRAIHCAYAMGAILPIPVGEEFTFVWVVNIMVYC